MPNLSDNPNYVVTLSRTTPSEVHIEANIPETFSFGVQSNYDAVLPTSIRDVVNGGIANAASAAFKFNRVLQALSQQIWQSSSPIEISLPLLFDAKEDAKKEVRDPIVKLMAMCLPYKASKGDVALTPPGPVLSKPDFGRLSLRIGRFFYIHSVVLVDANPTFDTRLNAQGIPISATCDITVRTINTPSQEDIKAFFPDSDNVFTGYGIDAIGEETLTGFINNFFRDPPSGDAEALNALRKNPADIKPAQVN